MSFPRAAPPQSKKSVPSSEVTELSSDSAIPWEGGIQLRSGVDALTGRLKPSALKKRVNGQQDKLLSTRGAVDQHTKVLTIRGIHQQSRVHQIEGRGSVNSVSPLAINASFTGEKSRTSSNDTFFLETVTVGELEPEILDIEELELTAEAQKMSSKEFRNAHGDYFVVGYKRRYWFHALVECSSKAMRDKQNIEGKAEVAWRNLLGLEAQAKVNKEDYKSILRATAWVSHSGCKIPTIDRPNESESGKSPGVLSFTGENVIQMIKSIMSTEQPGRQEIALLAPYSRVQVLDTLPSTVPVDRKLFDTLHKMEATAVGLHYDCLHPAFESYGKIATDARVAADEFRRNRTRFTSDSTALEDAQDKLNASARKVADLLVRYKFMEDLAKEWRGKPKIDEEFTENVGDAKWSHGIVSKVAGDDVAVKDGEVPQVALTDGTMAFHVKIEGTPRRVQFSPNYLHFQCRTLQSVTTVNNPLIRILGGGPCYIVGWTLSCRTEKSGSKSFSVKRGGIFHDELTLDIKSSTFRKAVWRCRIYYVNKEDYNFPHLNLDPE